MIDWFIAAVTASDVGALFLILLAGLAFGQVRFFGLTLGSSGVLFAAIVAGHFGLVVPEIYGSLGIIFFVYAVGLQAGPRFIHTVRTAGAGLIRMGLLIIGAGAVAALIPGMLFDLQPGIIVGTFAGAMTSTPALAAGLDVFGSTSPAQVALITVSYGLAYPIGVIGVVIPVQILPKLIRARIQAKSAVTPDEESALATAAFRVENPNIVGRTLEEANLWEFAAISISRVLHEENVSVALGSTVLREGDAIVAVGTPEELDKLELLVGPRTDPSPLYEGDRRSIAWRDISVGGRARDEDLTVAALGARYGVSITRVLRLNFALPAGRDIVLDPGDRIRVVGEADQLDALERALGHREASIFETDMLGLVTGILAGVIVGLIPWPITHSIGALKLGLAGGPLFVSILAGHFGKIGPITNRIPSSARFLLRELGLVFFLAYAGSHAGQDFVETFSENGAAVLVTACIVVIVPVIAGFIVGYYLYRYDLVFTLGLICGGMTSTPALGTLISALRSQEPALAYAAIYPIALIAVTAAAQVMAIFL